MKNNNYLIDYKDQVFGDFKVLNFVKHGSSGAEWSVKCNKCGNIRIVPIGKLKKGAIKYCPKCRQKYDDLTGQYFGRLKVLYRDPNKNPNPKDRSTRWVCECQCENKTIVILTAHVLKQGRTKSCGCLNLESLKSRAKHGDYKTPLYNVYRHMKDRCYNPNNEYYYRYGGRGIKVCPEWLGDNGYIQFKEDMGAGYEPGLSIDRINNDGDYCKENCRWTTAKVQGNNKGNNRIINYYGEDYTVAELGDKFGDGKSSRFLSHRLNTGWNLEEALQIPNLDEYNMTKGTYLKDHKIISKPLIIEPVEFDDSIKKEYN